MRMSCSDLDPGFGKKKDFLPLKTEKFPVLVTEIAPNNIIKQINVTISK